MLFGRSYRYVQPITNRQMERSGGPSRARMVRDATHVAPSKKAKRLQMTGPEGDLQGCAVRGGQRRHKWGCPCAGVRCGLRVMRGRPAVGSCAWRPAGQHPQPVRAVWWVGGGMGGQCAALPERRLPSQGPILSAVTENSFAAPRPTAAPAKVAPAGGLRALLGATSEGDASS